MNVSANAALVSLQCSYDHLTALDVSANLALLFLNCANNQLTSLNVSSHPALTTLECSSNQLASLNVMGDNALTTLTCYSNLLTNLDVSSHTALVELNTPNNNLTNLNISATPSLQFLYASNNQLTSLNVSANTALKAIQCYNNNLTYLNVQNGNNVNFIQFNAPNNPALTCIQVDNVAYSNSAAAWYKDATANYSLSCSVSGITDNENDESVLIYPNPTKGTFTTDLTNYRDAKISVTDVYGNCILIKKCIDGINPVIDLSSMSKGVYFLKIAVGEKQTVKKIVLQ